MYDTFDAPGTRLQQGVIHLNPIHRTLQPAHHHKIPKPIIWRENNGKFCFFLLVKAIFGFDMFRFFLSQMSILPRWSLYCIQLLQLLNTIHHITISERRLRVLCTLEHTLSVPPWLLAMSLVVPQMVLFHFPNDFPQPCATLFVSQPVCSRPLHACNCSWIFISFFLKIWTISRHCPSQRFTWYLE